MKNYRKSRPPYNTAGTENMQAAPVYFALNQNDDPKLDTRVALVYGPTGNYLGFTEDLDAVQKYLYGKLYYKTKGAYRINSNRGYSARTVKKIDIILRSLNMVALHIRIKEIESDDVVDVSDINSTAELQLAEVEKFEPTSWSFSRYPDRFNLLKDANFCKKFENEFNEMVKRQKQEVIEYLKAKQQVHNGINELALFRVGQKALISA